MPGGSRFELNWDEFRAGAVCRGGEVRLWSRSGKDSTAKFPDVQKALAAQVSVDCVPGGELVVWTGDRMDFDALQQRMVNTAATVRSHLMPAQPASFVAFDVLAIDSVETSARCAGRCDGHGWSRSQRTGGRRFSCPQVTADVDEAEEW
jgi:ATP-dependent DNA ligase